MSHPITLHSLKLKNILSFGQNETVVDFSKNGTISIEGRNIDNGGSNGSGKTAIINALCYVIFNKAFNAISLNKLINSTNATRNTLMEVTIEFSKGEDEYEISRSRGESYSIAIVKNGVDITPGKGAAECDALVQDIFGMSYELFTRAMIFSGHSQPFLELPIAQQRNLIEELFNISLLSKKAIVLRDKIKLTETDIKVQEAVLQQQESAGVLHQKHLTTAQQLIDKWQLNKDEEIKTIFSVLDKAEGVDIALETEKHAILAETNKLLQDASAKFNTVTKELKSIDSQLAQLHKELTHLNGDSCPYCSQPYSGAKQKAKRVAKDVKTLEESKTLAAAEINLITTNIENYNTLISSTKSSITYKDITDLHEAVTNKELLLRRAAELAEAVCPHFDMLETLKQELPEIPDYEKLDALKSRLTHQQFLLKLLTNKDSFLRQRVINKSIPFLNSRINEYTKNLGLPHIVRFNADMSCAVSEYGRELDFGNLSAGEQKRVSTALTFAFRDMLHRRGSKINVLMIDELDGPLDVSGIDAIVKILKQKSRDDELIIYVISHHPAISGRLDRNLVIQKEHGFSNIFEETL